ncbi:hypothetical protein CH375_13620 [Leptospira ellisii]|uniref:Alpha/beta hydrolase n=1 Tax=Leptospira ellisii TaxID=2023197 RepID=A0A2N0B7D9_9LEPT|nr:hypothetical protein CH379_12975 [Leptospira ellisii]PKA03994.1 hypothetical protein CH375_13620 [Leptospira ellisii]
MKNPNYENRIRVFLVILILLISTTSNCSRFEKEDGKNSEPLTQLGFLSILGCTQYQNAPRVDTVGGLTRIFVPPSFTFPCVSRYNDPHLIFVPSSSPKNILSVFLPGSGGSPIGVSKIIEEGARRGYHSVGLTYPNADPINVICNSGPYQSLACFGEVREETLTGADLSKAIAVDYNNSIEGRLLKLLSYLSVQRPNDGWKQFLKEGDVDWNKVHFGGHSQGSGHAAYQGKRRLLGRVSLYSGVSDYHLLSSTPASWLSESGTTPSDRYFGLIHVEDPVANFSGDSDQVTDVWLNSFGMIGAVTDADSGVPPYGNSQRLTTNLCASSEDGGKHNCTMNEGQRTVWDYISFP